MGESKLEGFRPTQPQTLGSGGAGLLLVAPHLIEDAIRWGREINSKTIGLRRVVIDNSVISRFEAHRIVIGINPDVHTQRE